MSSRDVADGAIVLGLTATALMSGSLDLIPVARLVGSIVWGGFAGVARNCASAVAASPCLCVAGLGADQADFVINHGNCRRSISHSRSRSCALAWSAWSIAGASRS